MKIVEKMSEYQKQPALIIRYTYTSPTQLSWEGGGYLQGQMTTMKIVWVPITYQGQLVQTIRYVQPPSAQSSQGGSGHKLGHAASIEVVNEPSIFGRQRGAST